MEARHSRKLRFGVLTAPLVSSALPGGFPLAFIERFYAALRKEKPGPQPEAPETIREQEAEKPCALSAQGFFFAAKAQKDFPGFLTVSVLCLSK